MTIIKRIFRILLVAIAGPLFALFPITGAFVFLFVFYLIIMGPLFMLFKWAFNDSGLQYEIDSYKEGWMFIPEGLKWVWNGDNHGNS